MGTLVALIDSVYNGWYADGVERLHRNIGKGVDIDSMLGGISFKTDLQYIDAMVCLWLRYIDCKNKIVPIVKDQGVMRGYAKFTTDEILRAYNCGSISVAVHDGYKAYIAFDRVFTVHDDIQPEDFIPKMVCGVKYDPDVYNVSDKYFLPFRVAIESLHGHAKYTEWLQAYFDTGMADYIDMSALKDGDLEREVVLDNVSELRELQNGMMQVKHAFKQSYIYLYNKIYKLPDDMHEVVEVHHITFEDRFVYIVYFDRNFLERLAVIDFKYNVLYRERQGGITYLEAVTSSDAKRKMVL